jgi:hypothetical protein
VRYGEITVIPSASQLVVGTQRPAASTLKGCTELAARAMEQLSQTPLRAAGVNIRFQLDELPHEIADVLASPFDDVLGDLSHPIVARAVDRTVSWGAGRINVTVDSEDSSSARLVLNFDRQSDLLTDLTAWLREVDGMVQTAKELVSRMGIVVDGGFDE